MQNALFSCFHLSYHSGPFDAAEIKCTISMDKEPTMGMVCALIAGGCY